MYVCILSSDNKILHKLIHRDHTRSLYRSQRGQVQLNTRSRKSRPRHYPDTSDEEDSALLSICIWHNRDPMRSMTFSPVESWDPVQDWRIGGGAFGWRETWLYEQQRR